jgi:FixJ family two-component response regulator
MCILWVAPWFEPMRAHTSTLTLIVVDDDEQIRRAFGRLLRSHGHEVHVFESAEDCLAHHDHADCAILDIGLPGLSGLELEKRLRTTHGKMPVVFVTARDELKILAAVQRTGCPFLKKPVDEQVLLAAIERAVHGE